MNGCGTYLPQVPAESKGTETYRTTQDVPVPAGARLSSWDLQETSFLTLWGHWVPQNVHFAPVPGAADTTSEHGMPESKLGPALSMSVPQDPQASRLQLLAQG